MSATVGAHSAVVWSGARNQIKRIALEGPARRSSRRRVLPARCAGGPSSLSSSIVERCTRAIRDDAGPPDSRPKRVASTLVGLDSSVTSTLGATLQCLPDVSRIAPTVSGFISEGVPPPMKIARHCRPGARVRSCDLGREGRAHSELHVRCGATWFEVAVGHLESRTASGVNAEAGVRAGAVQRRQRQASRASGGARACDSPVPLAADRCLSSRLIHESKAKSVREEHRIVAEPSLPRGGQKRCRRFLPSKLITWTSRASEAQHRDEVRRTLLRHERVALAPACFNFSIATPSPFPGPAQRAE